VGEHRLPIREDRRELGQLRLIGAVGLERPRVGLRVPHRDGIPLFVWASVSSRTLLKPFCRLSSGSLFLNRPRHLEPGTELVPGSSEWCTVVCRLGCGDHLGSIATEAVMFQRRRGSTWSGQRQESPQHVRADPAGGAMTEVTYLVILIGRSRGRDFVDRYLGRRDRLVPAQRGRARSNPC